MSDGNERYSKDSSSEDLSSSEFESSEDDDDVVDEENPVVKAKQKKVSKHPPDLVLDCHPSSISFHPEYNRISIGCYDGRIEIYSFSFEKNDKLCERMHSKPSAVREHSFTNDGLQLITAYSDHSIKIYDVNSELKLQRTITSPKEAVNSLYVIDENIFATGDDDGYLILWDHRMKIPATFTRIGEEVVTSIVSNDERKVLVCTTAEGAIYSVKINGGKLQVESEVYTEGFNCSCVFKQESKLAVGDDNGDLYIFNWNEFGKHSDLSTGIGRGEPINALVPITEHIILCGCDDGCIRAFNFFPHEYLGRVGKINGAVEKMDVCNDGHLIASIGFEETVKFWDVSYFENIVLPSSKTTGRKRKVSKGGKYIKSDLGKNNLPSSSHQNATDFYQGLAE